MIVDVIILHIVYVIVLCIDISQLLLSFFKVFFILLFVYWTVSSNCAYFV